MEASELREVRDKLGLTQQEMARALSVSFVTYNRWENEHREIPAETGRLLAAVRTLIASETKRKHAVTVHDVSEAVKAVGVQGVVSAAAVRKLVPASVIASLSLLPTFAWVGGILGMVGLGALSFFAKSSDDANIKTPAPEEPE